MQHFLEVILPLPLAKHFTYAISPQEADYIQPGMRIAVPFGKAKLYTALAYRIHNTPPTAYQAKDIYQILDEAPVVNLIQLQHWQWIAEYYMCTLGEVVRTALPSALLLESETLIVRNTAQAVDALDLKDDEFLVYEALQRQSALKIGEISAIVDRKNVLALINRLVHKGVVTQKEALYEQYKPKLVNHVRLAKGFDDAVALKGLLEQLSRAPKQRQALLTLFQLQARTKNPIPLAVLEKESGTSKAVLRALVNKGVLHTYAVQKDRIAPPQNGCPPQAIALNPLQQKALQAICAGFAQQKPVLLHGVTASGKTEVYCKLITSYLKQGKQILYLLPEIALTTQLINRLRHYFGGQVAVYHSKYNLHERVEVWNHVRAQAPKAQIVIGARSALFLPFAKLGLVVIDEEHEGAFKQFDPAPRYHARDAALVLARYHKADCVLGSATPSIESMHHAKNGKYGYATMAQRYGEVLLPEIALVDIREARRKKRMKGHFSQTLLHAMYDVLQEGEQIILFQNRRGFAPVVSCTTCGHVAQCANCDVSLTYHQHKNQLRCHYCGYYTALQPACLACGSPTLNTKGFGTEQIEQELSHLFPQATVGRMDWDTTRGKYAYEKIIAAFENHQIDILVGTQMVTKGLDFRKVRLVGVMQADTLLYFPDYRAHEKGFQMLTQVAGRAGRTRKRGKVLLQTYTPEHAILQHVLTADYLKMFTTQYQERERFKYPPVVRLIKITCKGKDVNALNEAAAWLAHSLRNVLRCAVLGPEHPPVARIRSVYLKNLLVKIPLHHSLSATKKRIKRVEKSFQAIAAYRSVRLVYHVDHV